MPELSTRKRLLFVDDEASIRLTLPPILEKAGFDVHVAESVADALFEINAAQFDILITDLNIGEEGDGFLVASGMRHIQPNCAVFILTGYPGFETALQAIRSQVDDYLVKPVEVETLVTALREKLEHRDANPTVSETRIPALLRERSGEIAEQMASVMKRPKRSANASGQDEFSRYLTVFLNAVIESMEQERYEMKAGAMRSAAEYGQLMASSGKSFLIIVNNFRLVEEAIYQVIQSNMTATNPLSVIADLRRLGLGLNSLMEQAVQSWVGSADKVAQGQR
jgi:ActR/RegA family two-component response regulator